MSELPTIDVFNTLGRKIEPLETREPGKVAMYVCGPTVQSEPHLGHGRFAVVFDVIRRYLSWRGYEVTYVRNITDVEDKIIAAAVEAGETMRERAERMAGLFERVFSELGVSSPDIEPKATEHIPEMIELISRLIERGLAYEAGNGDVYFSVRMLDGYGKLSGRRPDELRAGARVEISEDKKDPLDFALWKAAKPGEPAWDSPWGPGRPGWHIECSAMAARYLGPAFDIHGGGADLIFPHHENEIAQSEGATGETFARYWLHNGMVNLGGAKMSKSTGHLIDLTEAVERFGGTAVRLFYLRAHYRSPLEFSEELMSDAVVSLNRISRLLERAPDRTAAPNSGVIERFADHMDADFGTPEALGVLFDAVRDANRALDAGEDAASVVSAIHEIVDVLGLRVSSSGIEGLERSLSRLAVELGIPGDGDAEDLLDRLVAHRENARGDKDWSTADLVRQRLGEMGILVEDTADGARWLRR